MGAAQVTMPLLGESVTEGTVDRWLKHEGDEVALNEALVEVVTDKVNAEIPSPYAGRLTSIEVPEGSTVAVGTVIAVIELAGRGPEETVPRDAGEAGLPESTSAAAAAVPGREGPSAAVLRMAEERGVDLAGVQGSGPGGRVTRSDVLAAAGRPAPWPTPAEDGGDADEELLPLTVLRRQLAENMARGAAIPHAWAMREVDVTGLVEYRQAQGAAFRERHGIALGYLPFLIQAVCAGLRAHPLLNASWRQDGILIKKRVHLGIAVALESAVMVPVIRDADRLGLVDLLRRIDDLVARARERRLRPEDVQGGTFTLNNTGAIGGYLGMAIINHPQAAILTTGAIVRKPVVRGELIVPREIMNVSLTFDHRIVDGLQAGRFLEMLQSTLEGWTPASIRL